MDELERLVREVRETPKYKFVCEEVVRTVGSRELVGRRSWKEAVKATKGKLHQIGAAYFEGTLDYRRWLEDMEVVLASGDRAAFQLICQAAMARHASTRERLGILPRFFAETLGSLPALGSVIDIACGLNPLAIPWMPLGEDVRYAAYDIYTDMVDFLNGFMRMVGIHGHARAMDVTSSPPEHRADLALILKSLPCIEQLDKTAPARLLETLKVDHLLVSFPVRSLAGRQKGMPQTYERRFLALVSGKPWSVQRFEYETELAYLIGK